MGKVHKKRVLEKKREVMSELSELRQSPLAVPRFYLKGGRAGGIEVVEGCTGYEQPVLRDMRLSIAPGDRVALKGANGSGKTTLLRALLGDAAVWRSGQWSVTGTVGYLDQHYAGLQPADTVVEAIQSVRSDWDEDTIARHLGAFVFVHRASLGKRIAMLSEGERARLAMAQVAARAPGVLLLDEVTNNLDLRTKEHLIEFLNAYPGTLLINSHSDGFLDQLGLTGSICL